MDSLGLCWAFDRRWLFGLPFHISILAVWALLDILTLVGLQIERYYNSCDMEVFFVNSALLCFLAGSNIFIVIWSMLASSRTRKEGFETNPKAQLFLIHL